MKVANELQCEVLELEVMPDHVHMLCEDFFDKLVYDLV